MPIQKTRKWVMETASDGEEDMVRILLVGGSDAELKYIAMGEREARELITALEWMDSFKAGMVGIPTVAKPRTPTPKRKPRTLVLELEIPPKPKRPKG